MSTKIKTSKTSGKTPRNRVSMRQKASTKSTKMEGSKAAGPVKAALSLPRKKPDHIRRPSIPPITGDTSADDAKVSRRCLPRFAPLTRLFRSRRLMSPKRTTLLSTSRLLRAKPSKCCGVLSRTCRLKPLFQRSDDTFAAVVDVDADAQLLTLAGVPGSGGRECSPDRCHFRAVPYEERGWSGAGHQTVCPGGHCRYIVASLACRGMTLTLISLHLAGHVLVGTEIVSLVDPTQVFAHSHRT